MRHKFEEEIKRYNKFQKDVLGLGGKLLSQEQIDVKTYAKYVLRSGSNEEKRELMAFLKGKLMVTNKQLQLVPNS